MVINRYVSKGTDRSMVLTIFRTENPPFSPLAITARLYEPPRQTKALPVSNRLVAATPMGPRNPWAKGMVKLPML